MTILVEHSTVYRYDFPVTLEPHTFRLRPRMNSAQRLLAYNLQIAPKPAGTTECLDQDGNFALNAWFTTQTRELRVLSQFTVELLQQNPFDYLLTQQELQVPFWYLDPLSAALGPYRQEAHLPLSVKQFANSIALSVQWNTLAFLSALNQEIFQNWRHVTRPEGPPWSAELTLHMREGSCRDLAILFCDACRVMGLASRFVSGYECASAGQWESYMHAWAEVYLPSAGWRGYDPARGLVVSNQHVAVAAGFDHNLASPIAGLFFGAPGSHMDATLRMQVDPYKEAARAAGW
jgi:transglutaminase-like putative cysteine protease